MRSLGIIAVAIVLAQVVTAQPKSSKRSKEQQAMLGTLTEQTYRNPYFAFTYKVPFGWVDRTADMRQEPGTGAQSDTKQPEADQSEGEQANPKKDSQVLLAVFERPPQAAGETVNSAVVITAESTASYPGLKTAADYFGPLAEVTKAKGFSEVNPPYEIAVGMKRLVRADFARQLTPGVTMRQCSVAMLSQGYVVHWMLIASSEDEVDKLLGGLRFAPTLRGKP